LQNAFDPSANIANIVMAAEVANPDGVLSVVNRLSTAATSAAPTAQRKDPRP
jgi:hypothetical protein